MMYIEISMKAPSSIREAVQIVYYDKSYLKKNTAYDVIGQWLKHKWIIQAMH